MPILKKALMVFGLAYFVFPIDLLPDFPVLGVGYIDDLAVIVSILTYLTEYMNKYKGNESKDDDSQFINDIDYKIKDE